SNLRVEPLGRAADLSREGLGPPPTLCHDVPGPGRPYYRPRRTDTESLSRLVATTSGLPSPFTSPTASCHVPLPVATGEPAAGRNPPLPSPSRTRTPSPAAATTSDLPSPLKSATATYQAERPRSNGDPATSVKRPLPSPRRTVSSLRSAWVTTR